MSKSLIEQMATQYTTHEMTEEERSEADFETAYDVMVENARSVLRHVAELEEACFKRSRAVLTGRLPKAYTDEELASMFEPWWKRQETFGLSPREVRLLETIVDRNLALSDKRTLRCAFCGEAYEEGTPAAKDQALTDHIATCPKHPMREKDAEISRLNAALEEANGSLRQRVDALERARE